LNFAIGKLHRRRVTFATSKAVRAPATEYVMDVVIEKPVREGWIISLISAGHFLSHFYYMALPPMFLFLKAEFNVSYVELGLAMTAYGFLGGFIQAPVGFLVDHLGPRKVLLAGLGLNVVAIFLIGFVDVYWVLVALAVFAGLGNSVFHPADYAILSGSIDDSRIGRAFSTHTFFGFLGTACAPPVMLALAALSSWRMAFVIIGSVGIVVWLIMAVRGHVLDAEPTSQKSATVDTTKAQPVGMKLLFSPSVLLFLCFFIAYGVASGGLGAFTASALINLHGLSLYWANMALTGLLFGVAGGVFIAGMIVDRSNRHGVLASCALVLSVLSVALPALFEMPGIAFVTIMTCVGLGMGAVLPPRDLMIRAMTPPGEMGKVFGFVFVGFSIGGAGAPLLFGWLLDNGEPALVFTISAVALSLALLSLLTAQRAARNL
jgi:MFS transporter, FSR family, fosmidomycin resistance protein